MEHARNRALAAPSQERLLGRRGDPRHHLQWEGGASHPGPGGAGDSDTCPAEAGDLDTGPGVVAADTCPAEAGDSDTGPGVVVAPDTCPTEVGNSDAGPGPAGMAGPAGHTQVVQLVAGTTALEALLPTMAVSGPS
jgi:hypothetical protein